MQTGNLFIDRAMGKITIEEEMKQSYLSYAMSVIIGRALPDVRDGLKPVHRRVLYAMYELSNTYNRAYKKSARIVGDVIGKYHPHGDSAVYDTIVRMAQSFSLRYPLIDGQGNFGSLDGDPPAAMRYTEIRMSKIADEMLKDIDRETVDFVPNYDESQFEPNLLPARLPNLLINGSAGIAVGMATNIPPHNITEVLDGLLLLLDRPDALLEELLGIIKGPDFPTGGLLFGGSGLREAYTSGKGSITIRSKTHFEDMKDKRTAIVVTEVPYQINKAKLVERIAELVRDKELEGISDLRDESDKDGVRVVIELKREAEPDIVLNRLFKTTFMQISYGMNLVALVNGRPELLGLKDILYYFIEHRKEIIGKRTLFDLKKAEARLHIVQGLQIALDHIDAVISLIRAAETPEAARHGLMHTFALSELQAQAILDMRLQRLTGLEREKLLEEIKGLLANIAVFREILGNEARLLEEVRTEFLELKEQFGDERKTEIVHGSGAAIEDEELIEDTQMVVTLTDNGYIRRIPEHFYETQRRGGKGKIGLTTREEDNVKNVFFANNKSMLLLFSNFGKVHFLKVYQIPEAGSRGTKGKPLVNLIKIEEKERITAIINIREFQEERGLVMATKRGTVKKCDLMDFSRRRTNGLIAITLEEGDELLAVREVKAGDKIILSTRNGNAVCFDESELRPIGRTGKGVIGLRFRQDDSIVSMDVGRPGDDVLTVTENGYGKRTPFDEYRLIKRGGKGIITIKTAGRNGHVVSSIAVNEGDGLIVMTTGGKIIRIKVKDLPEVGRNTMGVRVVNLDGDEKVQDIEKVPANIVDVEDDVADVSRETE